MTSKWRSQIIFYNHEFILLTYHIPKAKYIIKSWISKQNKSQINNSDYYNMYCFYKIKTWILFFIHYFILQKKKLNWETRSDLSNAGDTMLSPGGGNCNLLSNFTFTLHFYALEKEMATHSSVLALRIPGTGEPVGCCLWGHTESDTTEAT